MFRNAEEKDFALYMELAQEFYQQRNERSERNGI